MVPATPRVAAHGAPYGEGMDLPSFPPGALQGGTVPPQVVRAVTPPSATPGPAPRAVASLPPGAGPPGVPTGPLPGGTVPSLLPRTAAPDRPSSSPALAPYALGFMMIVGFTAVLAAILCGMPLYSRTTPVAVPVPTPIPVPTVAATPAPALSGAAPVSAGVAPSGVDPAGIDPAAADPAGAAPTAAPAPAPAIAAATPPDPNALPSEVAFRLLSDPTAEIWEDGEFIGYTPWLFPMTGDPSAFPRRVELRQDGYEVAGVVVRYREESGEQLVRLRKIRGSGDRAVQPEPTPTHDLPGIKKSR